MAHKGGNNAIFLTAYLTLPPNFKTKVNDKNKFPSKGNLNWLLKFNKKIEEKKII